MKQEDQHRLGRKRELSRIPADCLNLPASPLLRREPTNILLGDRIQLRQQLNAYNPAKRILRRQQQRASLAGSNVDESDPTEIHVQRADDLAKQLRLDRLIRR